jgi:hypothetical protein
VTETDRDLSLEIAKGEKLAIARQGEIDKLVNEMCAAGFTRESATAAVEQMMMLSKTIFTAHGPH